MQNAAGKHSEALATPDAAVALWRGAPPVTWPTRTSPARRSSVWRNCGSLRRRSEARAELALGRHDSQSFRARGTDREARAARTTPQPAHARPLPLRTSRAARVFTMPEAAHRGPRHGTEPAVIRRWSRRSSAGSRAGAPRPVFARRPRAIGALALVLAAAVVAAVVAVIQGGTEPAPALAEADSTVLLRTSDGEVAHQIPVRGKSEFALRRRIDLDRLVGGRACMDPPGSGAVIATIGLGGAERVVFGEGSVWVTGKRSPTLFRIDPSVSRSRRAHFAPHAGESRPT